MCRCPKLKNKALTFRIILITVNVHCFFRLTHICYMHACIVLQYRGADPEFLFEGHYSMSSENRTRSGVEPRYSCMQTVYGVKYSNTNYKFVQTSSIKCLTALVVRVCPCAVSWVQKLWTVLNYWVVIATRWCGLCARIAFAVQR